MNLSPSALRSGHVWPASWNDKALSDREFLEKTLAAVKRRKGLIHGALIENSRVCALGALAVLCGGEVTVQGDLPQELRALNDSVPKATPAQRRQKVIKWLEARIRKLPKCQ